MSATPGPWRIHWGNGFPTQPVVRPEWAKTADDYVKIADVNAGREDYKANAALIAAAPDLLEALRRIVEMSEGKSVRGVIAETPTVRLMAAGDIARIAIAKAEGVEVPV